MKKFFLIMVFALLGSLVFSQTYNNEWIDYSKTYYKFRIAATGLYRIPVSALSTVSAALSTQPAEYFQLWRNGKQVPLYASAATGPLGATGYIEFWGERNDGTLDRQLYRNPANHLSDQVSLQTDSSAYYLTVNTTVTANLRFVNTQNNVAGNTLAPEAYFIHSVRNNYRDQVNPGYAINVGEYIWSSTYDGGEMLSTHDIYPAAPVTTAFNNLFVATSGPAATFRSAVAGSAPNGSSFSGDRRYSVRLNNTAIIDTIVNQFDARINYNNSVPLSLIVSNTASFTITNNYTNPNDRIVCGFIELNYPRLFNFGGSTSFPFTIPPSASRKYLEITNFNFGSVAPVLYDLTNNRRYVADISNPALIKIVLEPSAVASSLVLVSQAENISSVNILESRTFVNYALAANQADYIIISHGALLVPFNGKNQVEEYRAYRASVAGGSYNARIFDIEQLVDQFAFGVKKHPLSIKNFLRYTRNTFSAPPKYAMIIGHGLSYTYYRTNESSPFAERLNLVPTFGYPASDILLASNNLDPVMNTIIGRLSAVTPQEIAIYLDKVKQYEQAQANNTQTIDNKGWMKTVVHVAGGNDASLELRLSQYFKAYENTITDTVFGGSVVNFSKSTSGPVTPIVSSLMEQTWQKGISIINYFGHSSSTSLDYNLDDPAVYNNTGKYPMFIVNGCNAGNLFSFDTSRFTNLSTLSERFVLAPNKGSIGFIASTHFGLENYLDYYNRGLYNSMGVIDYGKAIGTNINDAIAYLLSIYSSNDFGARLHAEETTLHGDPAIKINSFSLPDYVAEEPQVLITPGILSVADLRFNIKANLFNIGKAINDTAGVVVLIKRQYPNGNIDTLYNNKIKSVRYLDSVNLVVPIDPLRDAGENKITVTIDPQNRYAELSEANNTTTKSFTIFEDDLRPVYPYDYAIINKPATKLIASTANPLMPAMAYVMEMDTTELFNSASKIIRTVNVAGGIIEFDPGITFTDSTVYYWRVAPVSSTGTFRWHNASFTYLNGTNVGFNQSHFYQHQKSGMERIMLDADRRWKYIQRQTNISLVNSIFNYSGNEDGHFSISVDGSIIIYSACVGHSVIFNVFDPVTMKPYYNQAQPSMVQTGPAGGFMNSGPVCAAGRQYNFEFSYMDTTSRRRMRDFMNWIPSGAFVTARLILDEPFDQTPFASVWKDDALVYGTGNSFYDVIKSAGFADIDSFNRARTWAFVYKKNDASYTPVSKFSEGLYDRLTLNLQLPSPDTLGYIKSPPFGPAAAWKQLVWRGAPVESVAGDVATVAVVGVRSNNTEDILFTTTTNQQNLDLSGVPASTYRYIKLVMRNQDSVNLTPYQLRYWRLYYTPVPEGALAPALTYRFKDTLDLGEALNFNVAFKNISDVSFTDSIKVKLTLINKNNVSTLLPIGKRKNLSPGDTANVSYVLDTRDLSGTNSFQLDVNPDLDQPEQHHFNNLLFRNFFVKGDTYNPLMDVTFDGIHILNGDIVSAKPKILIKLKDESKFLALDDTSLSQVFVQYPGINGQMKRYAFGTDTLKFIAADLTSGNNEAMIEFSPYFLQDSGDDFYELIVRAKDKSGNAAGNIEYKVRFQVINKAMISNMFNYPNPFTTSTAFVFTITGSEVPQNIRIQILTVTGKIVKDITKAELGLLRIGRNITEYKWDGTDQYGQKLANGVYLYRVITNLNGASLEKYNTVDGSGRTVDTDKFFNKGYGKMYLMR